MNKTKHHALSVFSVFASLLFVCASAFANPPGSYEQTCKNVKLEGETLKATCKRMDGSSKNTTLEFATSCVGVISNVDGNLACTGPTGSFARTCRDTRVVADKVYSTCQRTNGSWGETSSTFSGYQHPLTNCNGKLVDAPVCR